MSLYVGLGGAGGGACVSLCTADRVLGICGQERITRVRNAPFNPSGLPDEALDELLTRASRRRADITAYAVAESSPAIPGVDVRRLDHHFAHACAAFLPSPFESATIVVCDDEPPHVSIWDGQGQTIDRVSLPWRGPGFSELCSQAAEVLGFAGNGREQRLEALARFRPDSPDDRATDLFRLRADGVEVADGWQARLEDWYRAAPDERASLGAAVQTRIGDLVIDLIRQATKAAPPRRKLCVGGSLFYNTFLNSRVKLAAGFDEVFVPIDPGNGGLSIGAALHASGPARLQVGPFEGPAFDGQEVKATLDNCKLTYRWASPSEQAAISVTALMKGRLVAWFDGGMEWGPRALGGRAILANPFAPFVLDNLNRFLKQRAPWRGYALSGLDSAVRAHFDGPRESPFMECDYVPKDRDRFRDVLPRPDATVRVQTVDARAPARFRDLLDAFGAASGCPILVNTSFNGFREPIVCSPRDAVRVFFGTGVDVLILGPFVVTK